LVYCKMSVGSTHHLEVVFVWKQNYILVDEYFFFCCTWIVNSALKDCKGPAGYNVKVTLTGVEDSEQPGFLALDTSSTAQGVGIGMEKTDGMQVAINNTNGATFALTNGNNDINFRAWLQAKSGRDVTIGEFTASLTATFEYI
ncbi:fimbrial protein, partial [Escherichia coli]